MIAALLIALAGCSAKIDDSKIPLSEEELKYIATHPTVIWAAEENRPPYIYIEGKNPKGLAPAYIALISKKTGLVFEAQPTGSYAQTIEALRSGKVDVMTTVRPTPDSAAFMGFTPPFVYQGGVFVFRINTLPRSPLTTGILKDSPAKKYLENRFPEMNLIEAEDDEESISLLHKGLIDGSVTDKGSARWLTEKGGVLVRTAIINYDYPYSFSYRRENVVLGSILTKAISSITAEDKQKINSKWLKDEKK